MSAFRGKADIYRGSELGLQGGDGKEPGAAQVSSRHLQLKDASLSSGYLALGRAMLANNMADLYRKKVSELQTLLTDETARPQAMDLIRSMIDHIEIHVGTERGRPDVILVGALAQILTFTQQNKTAASNGSDGRVLMVAGVGFEPTTFRL